MEVCPWVGQKRFENNVLITEEILLVRMASLGFYPEKIGWKESFVCVRFISIHHAKK